MTNSTNRRRFERFTLKPMYTPISLRRLDSVDEPLEGHAYDVSEGGVRFDLDEPIEPGTPVAIQVTLPGQAESTSGSGTFYAIGNVVWTDRDPDEPGPSKMAAVFVRFAGSGDKERLLRQIGSGRYRRAA